MDILKDWLVYLLGVGIITVTLADVFMTVLFPRSSNRTLSRLLSKGTWRLFCGASKLPVVGSGVLSYCGSAILIVIVVFWVCALTLGFAVLVWPTLGSGIQSSQGDTPTDFATALYYSGYTITTLGIGDLVPTSTWWRMMTVLEAALGFSVITATITYLLSVYNALTRRNAFALSLYHRSTNGADAVHLLVQMKGFGQFEMATQNISDITRDLLFLLESYHAYPVIHYFRFREAKYSLARIALISLDLATLINTALAPKPYQPLIGSSAVTELENGGLNLLNQITNSFLGQGVLEQSSCKPDWRKRYFNAIEYLQKHGIEVVDDLESGADQYVAYREQWDQIVVGLAKYMKYSWHQINSSNE